MLFIIYFDVEDVEACCHMISIDQSTRFYEVK